MRFYCWEHSKDFFHNGRPGRVQCEVGPHDIGRAFPFADFWEQCAHCQTMWHAQSKGAYSPATACPTCKRGAEGLAVAFLCEHCRTFRLISARAVIAEVFREAIVAGPTLKGSPQDLAPVVCKACSLPQSLPTRAHYCLRLDRPFRTARTSCPFECGTGFFPTTLAEYAAAVSEGQQHPAWLDELDVTDIRLTQSPPGVTLSEPPAQFLLGHNETAGASVVLPQSTTFEECQGLASIYRQLFDYGVGLSGEIHIVKPAVVERVTHGWRLRERGVLAQTEPPPVLPEAQEEEEEEKQQQQAAAPTEDALKTEEQAAATDAEPVPLRREPEAEVVTLDSDEFEVAERLQETQRPSGSSSDGLAFTTDPVKPSWPFGSTSLAVRIALLLSAAGALFLGFAVWGWSPNTSNRNVPPTPTPSPTRVADPEPPSGMVFVRGGKFVMGRAGGDEYETPTHPVTVSPFFLDRHEVTRAQYAQFMKEMGHAPPQDWKNNNPGEEELPVTGVSWEDANAYAAWRSRKEGGVYRLPTEEEWEFAARGGDGRIYPWGDEWREGFANAGTTGQATGGPAVGCKFNGPSTFGACDMVGNVWEWTANPLRAYPGGRLPDDGLTAGQRGLLKVIRGGCYLSDERSASATYRRGWLAKGANYAQTGFRCAGDVGSQTANRR